VVFVIFTVVFVLRTVRDLILMGAAFYSTPRAVVDLCLATSAACLVTAFVIYNLELYDASDFTETMHYRSLFYFDGQSISSSSFFSIFAIFLPYFVRFLLISCAIFLPKK